MKITETKIAFCGTRGIPANYGGFETAVDEMTKRFVEQGFEVYVFCRSSGSQKKPDTHEQRRRVYVNGSRSRKLDTFVSSFHTGMFLFNHRKEYAHAFWYNNANLPGILMTLLAGIPTTVNTDGLEWRRKKWSFPFKVYYFLASLLVSLFCTRLVSDSKAIQNYYRRTFGKRTIFIPYGIPRLPSINEDEERVNLEKYGLTSGKYFLQITRFEPDNYPLEVARSFSASKLHDQGFQHVIVGLNGTTTYGEAIKELAGVNGVIVLPAIYDPKTLLTLRKNCFCYLHGNSVGGTNPALLEAMATCPRVLAIDCEFSRETLDDTGLFFQPNAISEMMHKAVASPDNRARLVRRVQAHFQWNAVAEAYMEIAMGRIPEYRPTSENYERQREFIVSPDLA